MVEKEVEKRIKTGVPGFDVLCDGGLIQDSLNLLVGNAGAGKTTFLLQFLYNGATKFDENGLYVSFEPEVFDLYRAGKKQGMDFEKLDKSGKCKFIKINEDMSIKSMQEKITKIISKYDIKRICFDPINVLEVVLPKEVSVRKQIYDFLSILKQLGVCVLIAGESDEESSSGAYTLTEEIRFSKYAVDGVIELFSSGLGGEGDRALKISKMRMTNHYRGPVGMRITSQGVIVERKDR